MKYFKFSEFDSKCGNGPGKDNMDRDFLKKLDKAREIAGVPFVINSGYRTPSHNRAIGSASTSAHVKGCACDIKATQSRERYQIIKGLMVAGFNRIGIAKTFIHCDNDNSKAANVIWFY